MPPAVEVQSLNHWTAKKFSSSFVYIYTHTHTWDSQVALMVKNLPSNARDLRDVGSVPGSGRSPGEGNGNPLLPGESHGHRSLAGYIHICMEYNSAIKKKEVLHLQ